MSFIYFYLLVHCNTNGKQTINWQKLGATSDSPCILLWPGVWWEDHERGKAISGSHQTSRNRRLSHMDNSVTRRVANRPWTPITQPRDFGSSVWGLTGYLKIITWPNYWETRPQYALSEPGHLPGSDAAEWHCQGTDRLKERIVGNKVPARLGYGPCWINERKVKNELGTFLHKDLLQADEEKYVEQLVEFIVVCK